MCMSERPPGNASAGVRGALSRGEALARVQQALNAAAAGAADPARTLAAVAAILSAAGYPVAGWRGGLDEEAFARLWWPKDHTAGE